MYLHIILFELINSLLLFVQSENFSRRAKKVGKKRSSKDTAKDYVFSLLSNGKSQNLAEDLVNYRMRES